MFISTAYQVTLEVFEGPLDLLLRLIEHEELDITKVSLAIVADQFLAHMSALKDVPAESLASFLAIAARLLVIKSRSLLPPAEQDIEEDEEDLGEQLARQLQEYRRFKEAASKLRAMEEAGQQAYPRTAPPPQFEARLDPDQVSLMELLAAFKRVLDKHPRIPPVDDMVAPVTVRLGERIQVVSLMLERHRRVRFSALMSSARSRLEVIVTFLAVLELIKSQRLRAIQEQLFGEIVLEAREPDPHSELSPTDLSEYGEVE